METGAKITTEELMRFLNVNIDAPDAEINVEIARLMTLEAVSYAKRDKECLWYWPSEAAIKHS